MIFSIIHLLSSKPNRSSLNHYVAGLASRRLANPWLMRSSMIAIKTILMPATSPLPDSSLAIPFKTSEPNPFAPIIDAITTIARAIIIVWLRPANIDGKAMGVWTLFSNCQDVVPNDLAASTTCVST